MKVQPPPLTSCTLIVVVVEIMQEIWSFCSRKNHQICCHQMSEFKGKMHQIQFRLGLRSRPRWGSLSAPPEPLATIGGSTSKGRGKGRGGEGDGKGKGRGGRGGKKRGEGRRGEGREGEGKGAPHFLLTTLTTADNKYPTCTFRKC